MTVISIAGGLAFFLYGMKLMGEGLTALAGSRLRDLVYRLTRVRLTGFSIGTLLGFAIHSGASTILLVSFIHAGMMTLAQSVPVMLGANVGTTLSMQLISFKVGKYALSAVALGVLLRIASQSEARRHMGAVILGFGLIFLGMDTMTHAVEPLREGGQLEAVLAHTRGGSAGSFALALGLSVLLTVLFQSSGATIGVAFALCQAGVFTELRQVFPIVLGAHIGTCSATLLGSMGTNIEARRSAYSHLLFNLGSTALAIVMLPLYLDVIPMLGKDMARQVANSHTLVQLVAAIVALPMTPLLARAVRRLSPSQELPPEPCHLDEADLLRPEQAISNALREERRMATITRSMLVQAMSGLLHRTPAPFSLVAKNEEVVDTIKDEINAYLGELATRRLSARQSMLLQHLMTAASDLERIADHIEDITQTTREKVREHVWFDDESMRQLVNQYLLVDKLLRLTILSLDPELRAFKVISQRLLMLRREFVANNRAIRERNRELLGSHTIGALSSLYYERYLRCFERIVRHTKSIARVEQEESFSVKPHKLTRTMGYVREDRRSGIPLPIEEGMLRAELSFDDLGIDIESLKRESSGALPDIDDAPESVVASGRRTPG